MGNIGCKADIIITHFDESINYIQIKTLTKHTKIPEKYFFTNDKIYESDMLIVAVDIERLHFALDFASNLTAKRPTFTYTAINSVYKDILYTDKDKFVSKLIELIPESTNINSISINIIKEINSLDRFAKFCLDNNIIYERNLTNGNSVDGYINEYTFQAKFTSLNNKSSQTYSVHSSKSAGVIGKSIIFKPYATGDFDFMIIEIGGTIEDSNKYKGNFCIIPSHILNERNILKTDKCDGKLSLTVCPPDYKKNHWSKEFWNIIHENLKE